MKKPLILIALFAFLGFQLLAQTNTVTGTVTTAEDGSSLPGVAVVVKGTTVGTVTDLEGKYSLVVPSNAQTLQFMFVGMKTREIPIGGQSVIDLAMEEDVLGLDEVVVTGVASGTATKKLGFAMTKVDDALIDEVPALDASNTLRGKVAGVTVVQNQGDGEASVSLRGAKSIYGNISPLIIVDGILTTQSLGDINPTDIASIEVVKGAAASSLYGSLAAGGVIQIRTKRGSKQKGVHVNVRAEYGISDIENVVSTAMKHPFLTGTDDFGFDLSTGQRTLDPEGNWSEYTVYNDNQGAILSNQPYQNYYASVTTSGDQYAFFGSIDYQSKGAITDILDPETRANVRMNFDFFPSQKFTARISTSYTQNDYMEVSRGDQGTFWAMVYQIEPFIDLTEKDEDGDYAVRPTGFDVQGGNIYNPLYQYSVYEYDAKDDRFVAGIDLKYNITDALSVSFNQSIDRLWYHRTRYYPIGYKTASPSAALNNGNYNIYSSRTSYSVTSAQVNYMKSFGDFNLGLVGKWLYEHQWSDNYTAGGRELTTRGVYDLSITSQNNRSIDSYQDKRVTMNYFLSADVDWRDKIIVNGMIRRDGSSLFGEADRWQTFWRGSVAYRLTEDFNIPGFNELKARVSYGTAGRRPAFWGQYETYSVSSSGISGGQLGNKNLKPAVNTELEVGVDGAFLERFTFQVNYAYSNVKNDYYSRPLSAVTGFTSQYQNLGAVKSTSFEIQFGANAVQSQSFAWDLNLTFDRIRSEITDLGGVPPFTDGLYRIEEGKPQGIFYGNEVMTSLSQLTTDANGYVTNAWNVGYDPNDMGSNYTIDQFSVNNLGYVVITDDIGTPTEQAIFFMDGTGAKEKRVIGDRNADFKVGFANTFTFFKNLQLYVLLDWKQGGDKYNNTRQYLHFNYRAGDQVEWGEKYGHHVNFSALAASIYNANNYSSAYVEDASYLKVREVSLSYSFNNVGNFFERIRLAAVGRNLFTITGYSGTDPEGYYEQFEFPLYRTFTGSIQLSF